MKTTPEQRKIKLLTRCLKLALAIIRNDAYGVEFHQAEKAKIRLRWAKEIETEARIRRASK